MSPRPTEDRYLSKTSTGEARRRSTKQEEHQFHTPVETTPEEYDSQHKNNQQSEIKLAKRQQNVHYKTPEKSRHENYSRQSKTKEEKRFREAHHGNNLKTKEISCWDWESSFSDAFPVTKGASVDVEQDRSGSFSHENCQQTRHKEPSSSPQLLRYQWKEDKSSQQGEIMLLPFVVFVQLSKVFVIVEKVSVI